MVKPGNCPWQLQLSSYYLFLKLQKISKHETLWLMEMLAVRSRCRLFQSVSVMGEFSSRVSSIGQSDIGRKRPPEFLGNSTGNPATQPCTFGCIVSDSRVLFWGYCLYIIAISCGLILIFITASWSYLLYSRPVTVLCRICAYHVTTCTHTSGCGSYEKVGQWTRTERGFSPPQLWRSGMSPPENLWKYRCTSVQFGAFLTFSATESVQLGV